MNTASVIVLIVAIAILAVGLWMYLDARKSRRLRNQFGPEYERAVEREGNARRAETVLDERQKRVNRLNIRELTREERERFITEWRSVQARFVDDPRGAVVLADTVVSRAMQARNYPMTDFDQRAADLSVEYPTVVQDYRIAHDVATCDPSREMSTEEMRRAMQRYRALFEELIQAPVKAA